jgi:hypothetical protein
MQQIGFVGLVKAEFPHGTARWCDGGRIEYDSEWYREVDPVWGAIGSVDGMSEGVGGSIPAVQMVLLPPGTTAPAQIHQPGMQKSPSWWWSGVYDVDTGLIDGDPELQFYGQVDQCSLEIDPSTGESGGERRVAMSHVSTAEVFFTRNTGNSLNGMFHKSIWPGELGHDEATGLGRPEAWGATIPSAQTQTTPGGAYPKIWGKEPI